MFHQTHQSPVIVLICFVSEDSELVVKMLINGRGARTCAMFRGLNRVDLDWLFESVSLDSNMQTNQQIADILTKGSFMCDKWEALMILFDIVSESHHRSHLSVVATLVLLVHQMAKRSRPSADEASKFTGASSK